MGSRTLIFSVFCLAASLAVACADDDSVSSGSGGSSGHAGTAGRASSAGNAGKSSVGGGNTAGEGTGGSGNTGNTGNTGGDAGEGGEGGVPGSGCTQFAPFVEGLINDSTTNKSVPTQVNGITFCDDPQDPTAFKDLF